MDDEKIETNKWFREVIKERREELGLTQAELAKRAGIGQPYVSKIESGVIKSPSSSIVNALAKALEMDSNDLWCITDDGEIGFCPNVECPGSEWVGSGANAEWEPYRTALEDEEGPIKFCVHCGTELLAECQNCGRKIKRFHPYCAGCGKHLIERSVNTSAKEEVDEDDVPF